jgi:hypothetical protein
MKNSPDAEYVMGGWVLYPSQWEIILKGSELQRRGVVITIHFLTGGTNK